MSEQKTSYMQELDVWTDATIIAPIQAAYDLQPGESAQRWMATEQQIKKAIREKILESYHNGQAAGPAKPRPAFKPRQR